MTPSSATRNQPAFSANWRTALKLKLGFRRCLAAALALTLTLLVGTLHVPTAGAYLSGCDTDPVFHLSNGDVLALQTHVDANPDQILSISYHVSLPAGVTVVHMHEWGRLVSDETVLYSSNQTSKTYRTSTLVTTVTGGQSVTATGRLVSQDDTLLSWASSSGTVPQTLNLKLTG